MSGPDQAVGGANDLAFALVLADLADSVTVPGFHRADLVVDTKPDRTWVTDVDRQVERALRDRVTGGGSGDAVIGEEDGTTGSGRRRWIIDPIDGTSNFVRRAPVWATLIALEVDGVVTVGVASAPMLGRRWWAARGLGAYAGPLVLLREEQPGQARPWTPSRREPPVSVLVDGGRIHVSGVAALDGAHLSSCGPEGWEERGGAGRLLDLSARCWRDRAFGDFWSHVLVAEGVCDIGLDPVVSLWDLAALQVIVEEAGGRFTDFSGRPTPDGGSAISTNGLLHDAVLAVVGVGLREDGAVPPPTSDRGPAAPHPREEHR